METGKSSNSDTFSPPENDHRTLEKSTGDSAGVGRSYECTFCKRGFTNAQALGGHMNIHRKDKAKAKQKNRDEVTALNTPNNNNIKPAHENNNYFRQIPSTDHHHHHHQQQQISYQVYLPPPRNPSFQTDNNFNNHLPTTFWRQENYGGHIDANLSLRIGLSPPPVEDEEDGNVKEDDDVDLELRL